MLLFDDNSRPIIIDDLNNPLYTQHMWVLDFNLMDFTMVPLVMIEETTCPTMEILVNGFQFNVPASWSILVYDRETVQVDAIELAEASGREFTALVYGPTKTIPSPGLITVTNYHIEHKNVGPVLGKHQMLCHPIGPDTWVAIGPHDYYNKFLKTASLGDIIG